MKSIEEIRSFFQNDRFAVQQAGLYIEDAKLHYAKCSMKITEKLFNAENFLMGGAIFTMADFTFAVSTNNEVEKVVTVSSSITYLGKAKGESLVSESVLIKDGKSLCTYQINISDNLGNPVATAIINGMKVGKRN